jgi:cobalt-zinc-cadmium efflux system outer membrane protein
MRSMRWIIALGIIVVAGVTLADDAPTAGDEHVAPPPAETRLKLEDCEAIALANHPGLSEAGALIDESRGRVVQSRLYPNPRIDSGNPQTIGPRGTSVFSVGLTQEIVRGGKLKLDQAAAVEASRQAEWESVRRRFEILTNVRQEFYSTLAAQNRRTLLLKQQKLALRSEEISKNLVKGGQATGADLLSLRVERRRTDVALQRADVTLAGSRRQLATTLGVSEIDAVDGSLVVALPEFDDNQILYQILQESPVVQVANLDVSRTIFLLRRAEVEPLPNVTIQGGTQYSDSTHNFQALVGAYVDVPLWNRNQGNINSANAAVRRSMAARQVAQQTLTKKIVAAVTRFRAAEKAVAAYEESIIPDATESLRIIQEGYAGGQFDLERLVQTQKSFFEANLEYISALEERLLSAAEIAGLLQLKQFP